MKTKDTNIDDQTITNVTSEVIEHLMNPKNYGQIENADGVGMGTDMKTGELAIIYLNADDTNIKQIKFATNACQDTVVAGSLFTEMIKNDTIEDAKKAAVLLDKKLESAPKKQQACSRLVLRAFEASLINLQNKKNGIDEEVHKINSKDSCEIEQES
jgi:nitrogen fixation NifU-like protein